MQLFTTIPLRQIPDEPFDLPEALAIILVHYNGVNRATLVTDPPTPQTRSPHNYANFCRRLVRLYEERRSS